MKRVLMPLLIAAVMMSSGCKKEKDNTIVTVDDMPILEKQVDEIIEKKLNNPFLAQFKKDSDEYKMLVLIEKDKAVNELIIKQILNNEIAKRNITVSTEELEKLKKEMIEQIGGQENFEKLIEKNGMSLDDFNTMVASDIQISKLVDSISPINISEAEIKKFYADNKASKFTYPESVKASHILIKDKAKAEQILAKAKAPKADFAALAKENSEDTGSAINGGDLGFFTKGQMVKPFEDAAFALKPDEISGLVQSEFGYHIIKVVDRKKPGVMPFEEIKEEIKKYLEETRKVEVLQKFIDSQKSQIKVEYVSPEFNPENIRKEVQKISAKRQANTEAPATEEVKK